MTTQSGSFGEVLLPREYVPESLVVGADSCHFAYVVHVRDRYQVRAGDWVGPPYDAVSRLTLSPDSRSVAFAGARNGQWWVNFAGSEFGPFDQVGKTSPVVSPDSSRVAYTACKQRAWFLLIGDRLIGGPYEGFSPGGACFSPDSRRTICVVRHRGSWRAIVDGEPQQPFVTIAQRSQSFSPDSRQYVYIAGVSGGMERGAFVGESAVVVDGEASKPWPANEVAGRDGLGSSVHFSPDSQRLAYCVVEDSRSFFVVDGEAQEPGEGIVSGWRDPVLRQFPSHDLAGWSSDDLTFSPDSRHFAYAIRRRGRDLLVFDGDTRATHDTIVNSPIMFSPDSRRIAYAIERADKQIAVVDDVEGRPYDGLPAIACAFSPDSRHLAYVATDGFHTRLCIDDSRYGLPGAVLAGSAVVWADTERVHVAIAGAQIVAVPGGVVRQTTALTAEVRVDQDPASVPATRLELAELLARLMDIRQRDELAVFLQAHPDLLTDEADNVLGELSLLARDAGGQWRFRLLTDWRALLTQVRAQGMDAISAVDMPRPESLVPAEFQHLADLAQAARERLEDAGGASDADAYVAACEDILGAAGIDRYPAFLAVARGELAQAHLMRFRVSGRAGDLDHAISGSRRAIGGLADQLEERQLVQAILCMAVLERATHIASTEALAAAVDEICAALTAAQGSLRGWRVLQRAIVHALRRSTVDARMTPEQAVAALRRIIAELPSWSAALSAMRVHLAVFLRRNSEATGRAEDLDEAISILDDALVRADTSSVDLTEVRHELSLALNRRFQQRGPLSDINRAIGLSRQVAATGVGSGYLGLHLETRYGALGDPEDLAEAIASLEQATHDLQQPGARADALNNLANALRDRYRYTADAAEQERAIDAYREAIRITPTSSPLRASLLSNLGNTLYERHSRTGSLLDLQEAVAEISTAVAAGEDHADFDYFLNNLGIALLTRHELLRDPDDLDRALDACKRASVRRQPGSVAWLHSQSTLATVYDIRYRARSDRTDIDAAIAAHREVLAHSSARSPDRAGFLSNLGGALVQRGGPGDFDEGVELLRRAVDPASDAQHRARHIGNLARALREVRPIDHPEILALYREAASAGLRAETATCLSVAREWLATAFVTERWQEAVDAFGYIQQAVQALLEAQLLRSDKELWLSLAQRMTGLAAHAYVQQGDLPGAVTALELGRTHLLVEAVERQRADLTRLERRRPDLVARYRVALGQLRALEHDGPAATGPESLVEQTERARSELAGAVADIQQQDGYEDFLRPPGFADIQRLATPAPLVYLFVVDGPGTALVVHVDGVERVDLRLDRATLDAILTDSGEKGGASGIRPERLDDVLAAMGEAAVAPLAATLTSLGHDSVVLIPTGNLGLLPWHAATYRFGQDAGQGVCLIDEFTVTYAPSARALSGSRRAAAGRPPVSTFVGVGDPQPLPPSLGPLPHAVHEVEGIRALLPTAWRTSTLYGHAATGAAVERLLPQAGVLHLACHAYFDPEQPLDSGLALANGQPSTLRDMLSADANLLAQAHLVVLSACRTAVTETSRLPDESVGLPGGYLQAGASTVIGSLWPVADMSTALLFIRCYELMLARRLSPAQALCRTQTWLRDLTRESLDRYLVDNKQTIPAGLAERLTTYMAKHPDRRRPFGAPWRWAPFVLQGAGEAVIAPTSDAAHPATTNGAGPAA
jgi:CHAT domain-containing protein/tetratricopeptide (TPR) repeat protein